MARRTQRIGWLVGGVLALVAAPAAVFAQGNTFNPYGNSGYPDYREFTTPMYSNNPALPGQARIQSQPLAEGSARGANQFEQYLERLDDPGVLGRDASRPRTSAPGMPYYRSFRQYDEQYKRVYTPYNTKTETDFNKRLRDRAKRYDEAMREPDAAKRAKLLRQIASESALDDQSRSTATTRGAASAAKPRTKAATPGSTPNAPRTGTSTATGTSTSPAGATGTAPRTPPATASPVPYPAGLDPSLLPPGSPSRPRTSQPAPASNPPTTRPSTPPAS